MGGQQLLEFVIQEPDIFDNILLGATNIQHSPWGIAFNESQRLAIEADGTFGEANDTAGINGMKAARSIGLIYRNYKAYNKTQAEPDSDKLENFRACSYQRFRVKNWPAGLMPILIISYPKQWITTILHADEVMPKRYCLP